MRQGADGVAEHDAWVVQNLLEFRGGFSALVRGEIGFATHIRRIETPKEEVVVNARHGQFIRNSGLQHFNSM